MVWLERNAYISNGVFVTSEFAMRSNTFHGIIVVLSTWSLKGHKHLRYAKGLGSSSIVACFNRSFLTFLIFLFSLMIFFVEDFLSINLVYIFLQLYLIIFLFCQNKNIAVFYLSIHPSQHS